MVDEDMAVADVSEAEKSLTQNQLSPWSSEEADAE
jgi:hypothetical protein